ncbi:Ndl1p KNAG_0I01430 [Huiozyma naganishii CBS 8797]|uniref:NUDE domain-containing protein n=1 Tax=Huiozyma naganishii (strain ATCC MYA-139 / BCRC 22969 / CBS 8797 / KCTC 17520 / NBRC 10181 / NCYC 3082 / Yp74L-3) TaxID=1071383 RepID=J7S2B0_HUIN7|nr:hypothetical protein KNAG_0I01430 [Kazachstania naganishii CBS 8797]CCK71932.1 hypothetical protein KNAG_0I01430 [Kazachstania naganishii CBS 8797]
MMDLPAALSLIRSLQSQLEEINAVSREYENEMEHVIQGLQNDINTLNDERDTQKRRMIELEIKVDDLENENSLLSSKLIDSNSQNDKLLERNVLLEHEVHDLQDYCDKQRRGLDRRGSVSKEKNSTMPTVDSLKVSMRGPSLVVSTKSPIGATASSNMHIPYSEVSSSFVVTTTSNSPRKKSTLTV